MDTFSRGYSRKTTYSQFAILRCAHRIPTCVIHTILLTLVHPTCNIPKVLSNANIYGTLWCIFLQWLLCSCAEALNYCLPGYSMEVFTWEKHTDEECAVSIIQFRYIHIIKLQNYIFRSVNIYTRSLDEGDRTSEHRKIVDDPQDTALQQQLQELVKSLPRFVDSAEEVIYTSDQAATLLCPLCLEVLDQPTELACNNLVCVNCCCKWIKRSGTVSCPCCYYHSLTTSQCVCHLQWSRTYVLGTLKLSCTKSHKTTTAAQYRLQKISQCQEHYEVSSPSRVTAHHILQRPMTAPTLPVEKQVAEHLVRRLMTER